MLRSVLTDTHHVRMDDPKVIEIVVAGHPEPGGSKTAMPLPNRKWMAHMPKALRFLHDAQGRPIFNIVDANVKKVSKWKQAVGVAAAQAMVEADAHLLDGPLLVEMTFYVRRNKGHFGTGANARIIKALAPLFPAVKPDVLKLARPVEDALTGIVWVDDSRTVDLVLRKRFVDGYCLEGMPGEKVVIRVTEHAHATVGERAEAAQGSFLAA